MPADILQITAKLDRSDPSTPWGFRMQGGRDFRAPVTIQRVTPGSLADKCGLRAGDTIVRICDRDTTDIPHKDAQQAVINAGNYLELILQRGGGTGRELPNVYTMYDSTGSPARTYSPTPDSYGSSMSPQLSRLSLNQKPQPYQGYGDVTDGLGGPQSKSFHRLQTALDNGEEIPTAYSPAPDKQRPLSGHSRSGSAHSGGSGPTSPPDSPKPPREQYHAPRAMYSASSATEAYERSFRGPDRSTDLDLFDDAPIGPAPSAAPPRPPSPPPVPKTFPKFVRPTIEIDSKGPKPFVPAEKRMSYEPTAIDRGPRLDTNPVEARRLQPSPINFRPGSTSEKVLLGYEPVDERKSPLINRKISGEQQSSLSRERSPIFDKNVEIAQQFGYEVQQDNRKSSVPDRRSPAPDRKVDKVPLGYERREGSPKLQAQPEAYKKDRTPSPARFLDENENKQPIHSRSFKILQQQLDSNTFGTDPLPPAIALRIAQPDSATSHQAAPTVKDAPVVNRVPVKQYNSPIGLYSSDNAQTVAKSTLIGQSRHVESDGSEVITSTYKVDPERSNEPLPEYDDQGRRIYRPQMSDTFKLIHERQKSGDSDKGLDKFGRPKEPNPAQSKTMKHLQMQLSDDSVFSPEPAYKAPPTAPANQSVNWSSAPSANLNKPAPAKWGPSSPGPSSPSLARSVMGAAAQPRGVANRAAPPPAGPQKTVWGRKGDAVFNQPVGGTARIPICNQCGIPIRGPFVLALGKSWCPDHFKCANCGDKLIEIGFVEENGKLYCERDYEMYFAPHCNKCKQAIIGDCVHALNQKYHPHCFVCTHCRQPIGSAGFHMEDGNPYCERDWGALYQTKCKSCEFPIEPGDLWLEALGNHYHSGCFNCASCQISLEGQSYFAKGGHAYCSKHAGGRF